MITSKVSTVSGLVTDAKGAPTVDGTVLVFSADPRRWAEDALYVRSTRPDQQGRYEVRGLPAGDYIVAALDYVEEGMWNDPEYLESVRELGKPFRLADGGVQTVPLTLVIQAQ